MHSTREPVRLIAADVDGTLLNSSREVTPKTMAAIRAAQEAGIVFAICTGRFFENASIFAHDLGFNGPLISLNGGKIALRPFGKAVVEHRMAVNAAMRVFELLEAMNAYYYIFADGLVAIRHFKERHHSQVDYGKRMGTVASTQYRYGRRAALDAIQSGIYKFYVYAPNGGLEELVRIGERMAHVPDVGVTQSSPLNLEVLPPHVDKEHGVKDLAGALGISMAQVMTIGDQLNDMNMIRAAGYGIAMGNAIDAVKEAAFAVTASNDEDGVALAIDRYALSDGSGQG